MTHCVDSVIRQPNLKTNGPYAHERKWAGGINQRFLNRSLTDTTFLYCQGHIVDQKELVDTILTIISDPLCENQPYAPLT